MDTIRARGVTVMLVLVFMGIFILLIGGLTGYVFTESKIERATYAQESAFEIAEAGLEYYRWFLAHNPGNLTDGTGGAGPYVHAVDDPESGDEVGKYALTISGNLSCGVLQSIDITSKGTADSDPAFPRTLSVRYAKPSVAEYAYIINDSVWAGPDRTITGPYHANGGIRMDGTNNSTVTSSVGSWTCTTQFGCNSNTAEPGVFGAGGGSSLWQYPVPQVDFTGIASDFPTLQSVAQSQGLYFPSTGDTGTTGYHIIFNADDTITVYKVTSTRDSKGQDINNKSVDDFDTIRQQQLVGTYPIPPGCPVIFVADKTWIEGTVATKVTLVADDPSTGYAPEIVLANNLSYTATDGTAGLTAIAEGNIRISAAAPDTLSVRGIFVAQTGYFGLDYYGMSDKRGTLTVTGTIVSNERVGTKWIQTSCDWYGNNCYQSDWGGYDTRINAYDKVLADDPPPFTPVSSPDAGFVVWKED